MTVGPPQVEGGAQRVGNVLGGGLSCAFDHGAASPLEDFYDPLMVDALRAHLVSEEPPMWVIDAPSQTEPAVGDEVVNWIRPFVEYVEEQTGAEAPWEPFNTKNALHQPPERCWVESGASAGGGPAEKLEGLQAFLRLASGGGKTFMDKGHRFAVKRYPHAGVPEGAESVGGGGAADFYAAEAQHVDRVQRCPDLPQPEEGEAKLYGEPTHFTLVVGFDEATGGTFFPNGRLLPGLEALPDGVSEGARGGILVQSMRGRALLWSNHRGSVDPASGVVLPLVSSLHTSVLRATDDSSKEPRRVCIFGWAQEGRKWERSGFHECLEYEPPKVRAEFFGRTLLQELEGWEDGQRAREVKYHLRSADAQREIAEGLANNTLSEATRNWLADYGYSDKSQIFQLIIDQMGDGKFNWRFLSLSGDCKCQFRVSNKSMKLEELVTRLKENFPVDAGHVVSRVEALDHLTRKKIENPQTKVTQGEQWVIVIKTTEMPVMRTSAGTQTASSGSQATSSQTLPMAASGSGGYPPVEQPPASRAKTGGLLGGLLPVGRTRTTESAASAAASAESGSPVAASPTSAAEKRRANLRKAGTEHFTSKHLEDDLEAKDEGSPAQGGGAASSSAASRSLQRAGTASLSNPAGSRTTGMVSSVKAFAYRRLGSSGGLGDGSGGNSSSSQKD